MKIKIYGTTGCPICITAKTITTNKGLDFEYIEDYDLALELCRKNKIKKFPVIEVDGDFIDLDEFVELLNKLHE